MIFQGKNTPLPNITGLRVEGKTIRLIAICKSDKFNYSGKIIIALALFLSSLSTLQAAITSLNLPPKAIPSIKNVTCDLPAPANYEGVRLSPSAALLTWSAVNGAAAYRLIIYDNSNQTLISDTVEFGTAKGLTGLSSGIEYKCLLIPMCYDAVSNGVILAIATIAILFLGIGAFFG